MNVVNVVQRDLRHLPAGLQVAQNAMALPEVQDMLRKLSAYNLGICMPHMHDEATGQFAPLAADVMQVETDLQVSFQPAEQITRQPEYHLPVAWFWRDEPGHTMWAHTCVVRPPDTMHYKTLIEPADRN